MYQEQRGFPKVGIYPGEAFFTKFPLREKVGQRGSVQDGAPSCAETYSKINNKF